MEEELLPSGRSTVGSLAERNLGGCKRRQVAWHQEMPLPLQRVLATCKSSRVHPSKDSQDRPRVWVPASNQECHSKRSALRHGRERHWELARGCCCREHRAVRPTLAPPRRPLMLCAVVLMEALILHTGLLPACSPCRHRHRPHLPQIAATDRTGTASSWGG